MTKADIINRIPEEQGIDRETVTLVIKGFMKYARGTLGRGKSVFLRGFGTFSLKRGVAKKAQNIQQHIAICTPTHEASHFRPSESFLSYREGDNRK